MSEAKSTTHDEWARLRFSIVGPLLAAPPAPGELTTELARLTAKLWRHPVTGEPVQFAQSTIERWYYAARRERRDPIGVLRRRVRKDAGQARHHPRCARVCRTERQRRGPVAQRAAGPLRSHRAATAYLPHGKTEPEEEQP